MFFVLLFVVAVLVGVALWRGGPHVAATTAFAAAACLPCWAYTEFGAVRLDVRTAIALFGIGCVFLHPQNRIQVHYVPADLLLLGIVGTIVATELLTGVVTVTVVADVLLQWVVPYALGRCIWTAAADNRQFIVVMGWVCAGLAGWAAVESIARVNPLGALAGHVGSAQSLYDLRWGLRRAEGPLIHPIFFGLHLVLMFPFAWAASRQAAAGDGPAWQRRLTWIVGVGAFFTMSRGPQMGILTTLAATTALLRKRSRKFIFVPLLLLAVVGIAAGDGVIDLLHGWSGEKPVMMQLDGELVEYSGTTHRLLQVRVYSEAIRHAGLLGYGSTALRAGANTVPYVPYDLRDIFSSIDNHYLQFVLQCGFLGLGLFAALCLTTIGGAMRAARRLDEPMRTLAAATASSLISLSWLMASVWLAADYRFMLLAVMGSAASLHRCVVASPRRKSAAAATVDVEPALPPLLQLSPGYRLSAGV